MAHEFQPGDVVVSDSDMPSLVLARRGDYYITRTFHFTASGRTFKGCTDYQYPASRLSLADATQTQMVRKAAERVERRARTDLI
ncbi:MAG: hypothetical protein ACFB4I_24375 [Cyanophyceae cyanobacterium]